MKTLITIAMASTFISGIAVAETYTHPTDESFNRFDQSMSSGMDDSKYKFHSSDEGSALLDRYSMYGFTAHDHDHNENVRILRGNPDTTILDDQPQS